MSKNKLLALKGLPASGKTTKAIELEKLGWVRVEKDQIRLNKGLFPQGYNFKKGHEKKVVKERNRLIIEALSQGKNVVSSDTNLNPKNIKELSVIARNNKVQFEVDDSFLEVSITECIERDKHREASVGENVIRRMYNEFLKPKFDGKSEVNTKLPYCIISDIDGTLAHMNGKRGPFEWHKVGVDDIDIGVAHVLDGVASMNYDEEHGHESIFNKLAHHPKTTVFLFSGRDEVCRPETEEWLERHGVQYDHLYMRRTDHVDEHGNQVKDTLVKEEMYEKYIKDKYNVLYIMDDRPQVCRMWRDKYKLRVMNLGDPYFEF